MLTVGSLFAGIGGIEFGLEWTGGFETVWQVEIDEYARRVLEKHWPEVQRFADIRECGAHNLAPVDLICGGFPCQDLSCAGKGAGLKGPRSGLWYEMLRVIGDLRPGWVLIENVYRGWRRWLPFVRRDLWNLGYPSVPIRLQACDFGLWHRRARVFLVAHADGISGRWRAGLQEAAEATGQFLAQGDQAPAPDVDGLRQSEPQRTTTTSFADAHRQRGVQPATRRQRQETRRRIGRCSPALGEYRTVEPSLVRRIHGIPNRLDRIRTLGNAVVPQCAQWIGERILEMERAQR